MKSELTDKQQRFLDYLKRRVERTGSIPSLRRAASDLGVSHTAVSQMLKTLEEKGWVRRDGPYSRNVYLLNRVRETAGAMRWLEVPVIGRIAAGLPLYAQPQWEDSVVVDGAVYRGSGLFALRVRGDSMRDAAIVDGDLVICEPRQYAQNGEIVVALLHQEEATVKRFYLHSDHVELRPENPAYRPARYGFDEILIQGRVVGVHRGPEVATRL